MAIYCISLGGHKVSILLVIHAGMAILELIRESANFKLPLHLFASHLSITTYQSLRLIQAVETTGQFLDVTCAHTCRGRKGKRLKILICLLH